MTSSVTTGHGPGPSGSFDAIVKTTDPAVISDVDGVYVASGSFTSLNVPVPPLHVMLVAARAKLPFNWAIPSSQISKSSPASTTAGGFTVTTTSVVGPSHPLAEGVIR